MAETVFERLHNWLRAKGVAVTVLHHEPVYTSEQAAAVRGTSLASGQRTVAPLLIMRSTTLSAACRALRDMGSFDVFGQRPRGRTNCPRTSCSRLSRLKLPFTRTFCADLLNRSRSSAVSSLAVTTRAGMLRQEE